MRLMEYNPLMVVQEYQPEAQELEGQEAFKRMIRNKEEMAQLFQSPQWKLLIEYLLSERSAAVNTFCYQDLASVQSQFPLGLEIGKLRMLDALISLPGFIKEAKLKDVQE